MGRTYGGVLGSLAFCVIMLRGLIRGAELIPTVELAAICLFAFAAIGYGVGQIAASTIADSVTGRIQAELQASQDTQTPGAENAP